MLVHHAYDVSYVYKEAKFYAVLFDTYSLMMMPCGLKHVAILSVIV